MRVEIVTAEVSHVFDLFDNLRDREVAIVESMYGEAFRGFVFKTFQRSLLAFAGLIDGKCVAIWGVMCLDIMSRIGQVWLIGSRLVDEHPLIFLRHSKRLLADLREIFVELHTFVLSDFVESKRWLEWLGFTIKPGRDEIELCELKWV